MRSSVRRRAVWCSILLIVFCSACAQKPSVKVQRPSEIPEAIVVRDVAVLDVESGIRSPGLDVTLSGGRIEAIEATGSRDPKPGARVIAGKGATLVPGLIDMHGHIDADSAPTWARGFADPEANLRSYLYSGVTTLFDPADASGDAFTRRARVASGTLIGPHIFTTGPIHTSVEGHPVALVKEFAPGWIAWYLVPRVATAIATQAAAQESVDQLADQGADAIKIVLDQIPLGSSRLSKELAKVVVDRARSHGLRVVAHIGTTEDAIDAAEAGVSLWVHGVYKERIPDDQIAKLVSYGIPMVATIEVFDRYARAQQGPWSSIPLEDESISQELLASFYPVPDDFELGALQGWLDLVTDAKKARSDNVRRLHEAGVTILAGSDTQSGVFPGPGLHRELANLVAAGLSPLEAIRAATIYAARYLGKSETPDFGNVAVGMRADLLLVGGDPLRDVGSLQQIREVFLEGVPLVRKRIHAN